MLASLAAAPLTDSTLVYEPKYDGIRVIAEVEGGAGQAGRAGKAGGAGRGGAQSRVTLWSRAGNDKTAQFPEVAAALEDWARRLKEPVVLDGELVALDDRGKPTGFQHLQSRIHLTGGGSRSAKIRRRPLDERAPSVRVAFIAFDVLRVGEADLRGLPLLARRARLERLMPRSRSAAPVLRMSELARGDGRTLHARALSEGWEGLIVKRADSPYLSGKRTPDWRKLKITLEQEFVIGGWTEPRGTRLHIGALLLGVYDGDQATGSRLRTPGDGRRAPGAGRRASGPALRYAGHTGTGFDERELARLIGRLRPIETDVCPFAERPPANERPHWVRPELVAEVRFSEWTADGLLRQPVYLGLRDDKKPKEVRRERDTRVRKPAAPSNNPGGTGTLLDQLRAIEDSRRDGILHLPDGSQLSVTNLNKVFWPREKLTKGDLFRYYAQAAALLLPVIADRPLVMKRYPNGIAAQPFYQHRVLEAPAGVRVETVGGGKHDERPQIIGGSLLTLLYTTQLAAISQDPWFSRVDSPEAADQVALDLDPMPGVGFARVLEVARWIRDELEAVGAVGFPKTSGADGLHIYVPLPPGTPYEAGLLFCQIVATIVATRHPKRATVERQIAVRGDRVYVDCLQNVLGRTLASAYSARASEWAGVSTPLSWKEVDSGVRREDFTIRSVPARLREVGDLWAGLRQSKGVDLARAARRAERAFKSKARHRRP
jgi:bifunctional non-homologous end joining protein LigD